MSIARELHNLAQALAQLEEKVDAVLKRLPSQAADAADEAEQAGEEDTLDEHVAALFQASLGVMPYLQASSDSYRSIFDEPKLSRAERLRKEADEIEDKDAAIFAFRAAVANMKEALRLRRDSAEIAREEETKAALKAAVEARRKRKRRQEEDGRPESE